MPSTKIVNLKDFSNELGAFTDRQLAELKKATLRGIAASMEGIVASSPVDTGLYAQSWHFNETEYGAIIGNSAPHAAIIEDGARPFVPPIYPLLRWAKRVLQDSSQPPDFSPDVWQLAKHTQKRIAERGIEPRHVMANAIPMIIDNIKAEYKRNG